MEMPHRLLLSTAGNHLMDGLALLGLSTMASIDSLTLTDLTGPHALLLASLAVVVILWRNNSARDKKDEARSQIDNDARERRHQEAMAMQSSNAADIKNITISAIRASVATAEAMKGLTRELRLRPCAANLPEIKIAEETTTTASPSP